MSHALHYNDDSTCSCLQSTQWSSRRDGSTGIVRQVTDTIQEWINRSRRRPALHNPGVRLLGAIGVARDEATRASAKLFWHTYARRHLK